MTKLQNFSKKAWDDTLDNKNLNQLNVKFNNLCSRYGLNPQWFMRMIYMNSLGLSGVEISKRTGAHRNSVNRYLITLKRMSENDQQDAVFWGIKLFTKRYSDDRETCRFCEYRMGIIYEILKALLPHKFRVLCKFKEGDKTK